MSTITTQEINEIKSRLDWLDEERRKGARKLAEVEQKLLLKERELDGREQRILELERQIGILTTQQARQLQIDTELAQFKDDIVHMIEQYDQRRIQSEGELDRLRRIEHESNVREIAEIRKELPNIGRLQQDMEHRIAEEARLANLIGVQESKISNLRNQIEPWQRDIAFLEEKEKQNNRYVTDLQASILEATKRLDPIHERLNSLAASVVRTETSLRNLSQTQETSRESIKAWLEQIQVGEHERKKQMEAWRRMIDERDNTLDRYSKEWIPISDQFKETKMVLQTITEWQKQVEQQQRENSELLRVESHRMQARWDTFRQELDKKWRTFEVEADQRWASASRTDKGFSEQFHALEELLQKLQQEKDALIRIQNAQTDAIKKIPRIWMEEIEKAIAQDPNRRRQPALMSVREE